MAWNLPKMNQDMLLMHLVKVKTGIFNGKTANHQECYTELMAEFKNRGYKEEALKHLVISRWNYQRFEFMELHKVFSYPKIASFDATK